MEYANAQCNIGAMGVDRGMVAWGTPSYVAGAQLGNAIGNAIRQAEFKKNCMIMQGWKQVPNTQKSVLATSNLPAQQSPMQAALTEWGAASNRCTVEKDKAACQHRDQLEIRLKAMGAHI
ncbi:hypothetical protein CN311_12205 [Mesorhizobium sanjuanii]|uniref:Uncharacterized protein n=1 Tax=Mesorhizobium sanjuanii TaxID=2037900 RepID=A0A2A6FGJ3_9HYPH|nr:hypothetical protein CN311_12205 [Mesorhizobium sanjuanii]